MVYSSLPTEAEKRAAALVVSRYRIDQARLQAVVQTVAAARARGQDANLLQMLVVQKLLTPAQAEELRLDLDSTHVATPPSVSPPKLGGDTEGGASPAGQRGQRSPAAPSPSGNGTEEIPSTASGYRLRALGEFRLLRRLGEGGMGSVYLGYQESQGRQVAVKVLADNLANNQAFVDRFHREAKSGIALDHPNIVRCIAASRDQASGKHYLVLEFVDGPSARALLEQFGRLSVGDAVHIALDIARALEHVHARNFVHRDIKPDNILITQSGVAKLGDLGLAKRMDDVSHLTAARQGVGTPYYMPYEQVISAKQVDGRCDIYALGATLYHLVTGEVPFPGDNTIEIAEKKLEGTFTAASALNPKVPEALDRILAKMMARHPRDRYQTASELIVDLERANLAAAVPSFTDPDTALQDPVVRARLTSPAQPTQPDVQAQAHKAVGANGNPDVWYLRYRDKAGRLCKTKGTTQQIVQRLREGRLPSGVEACHERQGEFRLLSAYTEFRSVTPAAKTLPKEQKPRPPKEKSKVEEPVSQPVKTAAADQAGRRRLLVYAGLAAGLIVCLAAVVYKLLLAP